MVSEVAFGPNNPPPMPHFAPIYSKTSYNNFFLEGGALCAIDARAARDFFALRPLKTGIFHAFQHQKQPIMQPKMSHNHAQLP